MSIHQLVPSLLPLAAALFALVPAAHAGSTDAPKAKQLTLRLSDVPGYVLERTGPDPTCSLPVFVNEVRRDVLRLEQRFWIDGCNILLDRAWAAPGVATAPQHLQSVTEILRTPEAAAALLARPRGFAASVIDLEQSAWTQLETTASIGDETRLLRTAQVPSGDGRHGVAVLWRSGSIVALVLATGGDATACEQAALRLAAIQQARIANPTPLLPGDFDDLEVPLDDPRLDVPIVWVGRELDSGSWLPRVHLQTLEPLDAADRRQGLRAAMTYGLRRDVVAFQLLLAHPSLFDRPPVRRELRNLRRDRCVRTERVVLTDGTATLYARRPRCRARALEGEFAIVRLRGVRISILPEYGCPDCVDVVTPWASDAGVRAVLRALRPR